MIVMPPVTAFGMDAGMAFRAKGDEIPEVAGAAFSKRNDVVHLLDGHGTSFFQALLAERMRSDVGIAYAFPRPAIALGCFRVALVPVVVPVDSLGMFLTVASFRQLRTAGIGAWSFGSSGHGFLRINEELPPLLVETPFDSDFMVPL